MSESFYNLVNNEVSQIVEDNLFKNERFIVSPQQASIKLDDGKNVLNFCANDYLGLANNELVKKAAAESIGTDGFGMASVRFICGTHDLHRQLETKLSHFLGFEDSILYVACFDANGGLFEPLFSNEDAIISDALNHASIIDGIRLCKAQRYRYEHSNMNSLEECLRKAKENQARHTIIATDGVFSMDGTYAKLDKIYQLAQKYNALIMVDDCHATGFVGENGKGTPEYFGLEGKIDILTGTLGKALGGASGGFVCAKENVVKLLKQRSRPYLFSNALSPSIVKATLQALEIIENEPDRRYRIKDNTAYFQKNMKQLGFDLKGDSHPITPVMLGDAETAQKMSAALLDYGLYAVGFFYPVVPKGEARIRLQLTSEHTRDQINKALKIFEKVGKELNVI